jgi:hypothetical protein
MKIVNLEANAQFYLYASPSSGGKTLKPGEWSTELPLHHMHIDVFKRDLKMGRIGLRLSEQDKLFLKSIHASDTAEVKIKVLPPPPPKPKKAAKKLVTAVIPLKGGKPVATKTSDLVSAHSAIPTWDPITRQRIDGKPLSLNDLKNANMATASSVPVTDETEKTGLQDVRQFMGSRV